MPKNKVLVDSGAFIASFEKVAMDAQKSIYVQTMSFEGDATGEWLINCLLNSKATDIRLCLDSYSKFVVNDYFVHSLKYFRDKAFRDEIINTKRLVKKARAAGIQIKYTNPLGFLFLRYPLRNHKKMVIVDEKVSYIGGINFCDHNFEWHDMMVEVHDEQLGQALAEDVRTTFTKKDQSRVIELGETKLFLLDGIRSQSLYDQIFDSLKNAQQSIEVFSPYVSDPLLSYLREHKPTGVTLDIISPAINNKSLFKKLLATELTKGYFNLLEYQGRMSHLKAILIDRKTLIVGSSNFDFVSYYFEQEVVMVTTNNELVKQFIDNIAIPDKKNSVALGVNAVNVDVTLAKLMSVVGKLSHQVAKLIFWKRKLTGRY